MIESEGGGRLEKTLRLAVIQHFLALPHKSPETSPVGMGSHLRNDYWRKSIVGPNPTVSALELRGRLWLLGETERLTLPKVCSQHIGATSRSIHLLIL